MKGLTGAKRTATRYMPAAVIAVVLLAIAASVVVSHSKVELGVSLQPYFPRPTSYTPGVSQSNLLLMINYTGPGTGLYSYLVTYNSSAGTQVAGRGVVSLPSGTSSSVFFLIPIAPAGTVLAQAQIFKGGEASGEAVYTESLSL